MEKIEIQILEYLYYKGIEHENKLGCIKGVYSTPYFSVEEMSQDLECELKKVESFIANLYDNNYIEFNKGDIGLSEIGWSVYIDQYYKS